ncbi:(2Fe-2S)-binding protein [candidate division KSB1 bacterium]|nr:MAG: (2Fe-2S)-binding protein [candidate division KSB1 bacterium]
MTVRFILNKKPVAVEVESNRRLLDVLREELRLTGTKEGCGIGECGACTVLLNGKAVNSCLVLIGQVEGAEVTTIEGVAEGHTLHPLQKNFLATGAVQCGFCTPGILLSAYALLTENPHPTDDEIAVAIAGNLCRCTGYKQIMDAIRQTARENESINPRHG